MGIISIWCLVNRKMEATLFLKAKLNLVSGIAIGAAATMVMKQICKCWKKQRGISVELEKSN